MNNSNVSFSAVRTASNYCTCDICNALGKVTKVFLPLYIRHEYQKTVQYWFCDSCLSKLKDALDDPGQEN